MVSPAPAAPAEDDRRLVRQVWLLPSIAMVLALGILIGAWQALAGALIESQASYQKLTTLLTQTRNKLNQVSQEEREIIDKSNRFLAWEQQGIVGILNELDLQDYLYAHAKQQGIGEFEYLSAEKGAQEQSISALLKKSNKSIATPNDEEAQTQLQTLSVRILPQTMHFKLLHEKMLFDFLQTLTTPSNAVAESATGKVENHQRLLPPSLARINQCQIERINPHSPLLPTQANFQASCQIDWINVVKSPSSMH